MPDRFFLLNNVQQMARDFSARCTWDFSQGYPLQWINGPAGNGICMSLACHWIKYHAQGDSLVNRLGAVWNGRDRIYTPFNQTEYQRLAQWQRQLARFPNWVMAYQAWFRNNQMRILGQQNDVPMNMGALKHGLQQINGAYALIILGSRESRDSHAVSAYIGGNREDACFFDPNYGEYWFENREQFFQFFHFFSNFIYRRNHTQHMGFDSCEILRVW